MDNELHNTQLPTTSPNTTVDPNYESFEKWATSRSGNYGLSARDIDAGLPPSGGGGGGRERVDTNNVDMLLERHAQKNV
jgi:hypothetical protein